MGEGSFLFMEAEQPLCLASAGFGNLEFLAAGDVALTRRACCTLLKRGPLHAD
jgi:hypothetical protein